MRSRPCALYVPYSERPDWRIACSAASHAHGLWAKNRPLFLRRRCNYTVMAFTPKAPATRGLPADGTTPPTCRVLARKAYRLGTECDRTTLAAGACNRSFGAAVIWGPGWWRAAHNRVFGSARRLARRRSGRCAVSGRCQLEPHRPDPRRGQDLAAAAWRPARPLRKRAARVPRRPGGPGVALSCPDGHPDRHRRVHHDRRRHHPRHLPIPEVRT